VVIKPSGISYEAMTAADVVVVDLEGHVVEGERAPSSETPMHTRIYREFPEVNAVVHTHSRYALAFAVLGRGIPVFCNEFLFLGGPLPVADYACAGTEAIGRAAVAALKGPPPVKGVLLRNHGALAVGAGLDEASDVAATIEILAQVYHLALQVGEPTLMSEAQIAELREVYA
jgi:L-ribulose-5-phosphate 4-epimerase